MLVPGAGVPTCPGIVSPYMDIVPTPQFSVCPYPSITKHPNTDLYLEGNRGVMFCRIQWSVILKSDISTREIINIPVYLKHKLNISAFPA